ncbi:MAG: outer membrane lipoprotein chaperone LolA [Deltaproteobacteria bacterium]|nr:outer membrane lipoprotein chaperone LolA [Deltaproteobacteria bacterium]
MRVLRSVCCALLTAAFLSSAASAAEVNGVVERLQKHYESVSTIEAAFAQEVFSKSLNRSETNEGRVFFKKPGKWKWLYNDPAKGVFTSNGRKVWLFEPDFNQVLEKDVDASSPAITTDFLTGVGNLRKDFDITLAAESSDAWRLELAPKQQLPNVKKLFLEVDKTKLMVVKTVVVDYLGNEVRISFKDIKANQPVNDSLFEFKPPKGAVIVRP